MKEPILEPATLKAVVEIVKQTYSSIVDRLAMGSDSDPKAKSVEWYRGGAQVCRDIIAQLEGEDQRRRLVAADTPEDIVSENLRVLEETVKLRGGEMTPEMVKLIAYGPTAPQGNPDNDEL